MATSSHDDTFYQSALQQLGIATNGYLDRGGFGVVYRGRQQGTMTALKMPLLPNPGLSVNDQRAQYRDCLDHLKREHEAYVRLSAIRGVPFQSSLLQSSQLVLGFPLYVLTRPFIIGASLEDRRILSHDDFHYICTVIGNCHMAGVADLDIKRDNIIVSSRHRPVLIDFGKAVFREETRSRDEFDECRDRDFRTLRLISHC